IKFHCLFCTTIIFMKKHQGRYHFLGSLIFAKIYLPGYAIPVPHPAIFFTPWIFAKFHKYQPIFCKCLPITVHLLFTFTKDHKGNGGILFKLWPCIQNHQFLAEKLNVDDVFCIYTNFTGKSLAVKICSISAITVEPEAWENVIFHNRIKKLVVGVNLLYAETNYFLNQSVGNFTGQGKLHRALSLF